MVSFFSSIRTRLILLALLVTLPMAGLTLFTAYEERRIAVEHVQQNALQLAHLAANEHEGLIEATHQLLVVIAQVPVVRSSPEACSAFLADLLGQYQCYSNFGVVEPDGNVYCSGVPLSTPENYADQSWFQQTLQRRAFSVSDYRVGRITGEAAFSFSYPVLDQQGQVEAVIYASMSLDWLAQFTAEAQLPPSATVTVIDSRGLILTRFPNPEDWVGQQVPETYLYQKFLEQGEGVEEARDLDGTPSLLVFVRLKGIPEDGGGIVSIANPIEVVYDQASRTLTRNLIALGLVTLMAISAAWFVGEVSIVHRIRALLEATRRVSSGDLSARTGIAQPRGELSQLAFAFDQMAESLQQREIERKQVKERLRGSEERYRNLFDGVPIGLYQTVPEGQFLDANPALLSLLGYPDRESMLAVNATDLYVNIEDREQWAKLAETGEVVQDFEVQWRRHDGTIIWVLDEARIVRNAENQVIYKGSVKDITVRKRAEEQVRQNAARAEALVRTAACLNADLKLDAVLIAVCEETARALNVPAVCIFLRDDQNQVLNISAIRGLPKKYQDEYIPTPLTLYEQHAQKTGPIIVVSDVQAEPGLPNQALYVEMDIRTAASANIQREEQLLGTLTTLTIGQVRQFTEDELVLLKGLADQAAQAINNAQLFEDVKRRSEQMQALYEIDRAIAGSIDLKLTLNVFLEQVIGRLGVDAADVLLLNPSTRVLNYVAGRGFLTDALQHTHLRLGEGYAGKCAQEQKIVHVSDLHAHKTDFLRSPSFKSEEFDTYFGVPLIAKGWVKGVLEIFHRSSLQPDQNWMDFMKALSGQAAIAIDNASLFDDLQRSHIDLIMAYDATIEGWSFALDLRDEETEGHTRRVTKMTEKLACEVGMSEVEQVHIRRGALLHDIGKMGVPDTILLKPGPLTDEEWVIMRKHPQYAFEMLSPINYLRLALDIPYCHHEKWDGSGYPRGLK
ncbi:MAG: HD domain-containing phosphohydrolase, partial [Chloroflexota bacterium]